MHPTRIRDKKMTKKRFKLVTVVAVTTALICAGIFYACKKDVFTDSGGIKSHKSMVYYDEDLVNDFMNEQLVGEFRQCIQSFEITKNNEILCFRHEDDVEALYDRLIHYSNSWDAMVAENERYAKYLNSERFPRHPMLFAFEVITNFNSLRVHIENQLLELEAGDGIDLEENPDRHYIVSEYNRAFLTPDCELIVGTTIYLTGKHQNIVIFDLDFDKLRKVKALWRQHGETDGTVRAFQQSLAYYALEKSDSCKPRCEDISMVAMLDPSAGCPPTYNFSLTYAGRGTLAVPISQIGESDCDVLSIIWNFGDKQSISANTPKHTYNPGTYAVKATVKFRSGLVCEVVKNITVSGCMITIGNPVYDATFPGPGAKYKFSANAVSCTGSKAKDYIWTYGDNSPAEKKGDNTEHVYATNGPKTVSVSVVFEDGCTASTYFTPTIAHTGNCCKYWDYNGDRDKTFEYNNHSYKLTHFFTTRQGPLWHRIVVKNTFYKKNNKGKWKSEKAHKMFANFSGQIAKSRECNLFTIYPQGCSSSKKDNLTYDYGVGESFWIGKKSIKSAFTVHATSSGQTDSRTDVLELHDANCN